MGLIWAISIVTLLISLLITTHEPPSMAYVVGLWASGLKVIPVLTALGVQGFTTSKGGLSSLGRRASRSQEPEY